MGTVDMLRSASPDRLLEAGERAYAAGALSLAATVDLQLLGLYAFLYRLDEAVVVGTRAVELARTMRLRDILVAALLQLASVHALARRERDMEAAIAEALAVSGTNPEAQALAAGHARATYRLMVEDGDGARRQLEAGMAWARQAPAVPGMFPALWALLRAVDGDDEAPSDPVVRANAVVPVHHGLMELALAVVDGRQGRPEEAAARADRAERLLLSSQMPGPLHLARRHAAEAALADGWGTPAAWLSEALHYFEARDNAEITGACRALLRQAGHRAPRAGSGDRVPEPLRPLGVTAREAEVLHLVGDRLSNTEIAARLHLSTRTVEKHVERLLRKTGTGGRRDLVDVARRAGANATAGPFPHGDHRGDLAP
jgi:ATP/maltotriose-dependent transcriptional regulator MalT